MENINLPVKIRLPWKISVDLSGKIREVELIFIEKGNYV
jgi:hypothetical protein